MKRPKKCVRLGCMLCDRGDYDGIAEKQLETLRLTWDDITEQQTWEESLMIWTEEEMLENFDWSNLLWWTHAGTCPECIAAGDEYHERIAARNAKQATLF